MRLKLAKRRKASEENLVPLINIVFLILIFFLVASTIRPFTDRDITLAESREASGAGAMTRAILIHEDGVHLIDGIAVPQGVLAQKLREWAADPDGTVTIVADRAAAAERIVDVVATASSAGLRNVRLLTRRSR